MRTTRRVMVLLIGLVATDQGARAWGGKGHQSVGAIADALLQGTHAATQVQALLGTLTLQDVAVWADCAKGVDPKTLTYTVSPKYPECAIFENPAGEAEMIDFVTRNNTNCPIKKGEEICHKQYHYTDISIAHDHYDSNFVGARTDDIVGAVTAAVEVLKGNPAPAPFDFKDKKEALLVLSHYVGDLHQPLHVGAVYLNAKGERVDPDKGTFDTNSATRGGNEISVGTTNLHALWDDIPSSLEASQVSTLKTAAAAIATTPGPVNGWSTTWGSETVAQARKAFKGIKFGAAQGKKWPATLPNNYSQKADAIKEQQIVRAGARLAQLLEAVWP